MKLAKEIEDTLKILHENVPKIEVSGNGVVTSELVKPVGVFEEKPNILALLEA